MESNFWHKTPSQFSGGVREVKEAKVMQMGFGLSPVGPIEADRILSLVPWSTE